MYRNIIVMIAWGASIEYTVFGLAEPKWSKVELNDGGVFCRAASKCCLKEKKSYLPLII